MSPRKAVNLSLYAAGLVAAGSLALLAKSQQPAAPAPEQPPSPPASVEGQPRPSAPPAETDKPAAASASANGQAEGHANGVPKPPAEPDKFDDLMRRIRAGEPTVLSFKSASVSELLPLIVEYTGKVVMPSDDILARKITIVNDRPIDRAEALDLVLLALQQRDIAVIETGTIIFLRDKAEVDRQLVPIIPADESLLNRRDVGAVVQKIFGLKNGSAANIGDIVRTSLPDSGKLTVDLDSNQILITGPIALLQRMEKLIDSLDKPSTSSVVTETFHLRYADADAIAANIRELFQGQEDVRTSAQTNALQNAIRATQPGGGGQRPPGQPQQPQQAAAAAASSKFRVSSNRQQNAVTVIAEPQVMEKIRKQVSEEWDKELDLERSLPKVFKLKYADPIKTRDTLEGLFSSSSTRTTSFGGFFGGSQSTTSQGATRLAGQFSFQASPEQQAVIVVAKSPDNMRVIEDFLKEYDTPRSAGIPRIVELNHATAEDLSEQLNALLATEGTLASVRRVNTDLSSRGQAALSPFSSTTFESTDSGFSQTTQQQPQSLNFWWQRARPPTTDGGASTLVGKIRIVPVQRRNAVMVLAPPEYSDAVVELIERLDRPGRQVLIAAVICELSGEDATAIGLRFSNTAITPSRQDNTVGIGAGSPPAGSNLNPGQVMGGTKNNLLPGLFDTSVLNIGVNLNVLLQALAQETKVTILSEPRIFTGDNEEANFFDGQDIPFITDTQTTDLGNLVQSFDYRAVGINLRVRPRITPERDVDLKVDLELSSIQPQQTLFGGFIVDRRQTTTQLIVKDGQTIVISGIMRSEDSDIKRKVPLLGDIPFIGALFTSIETVKTNTELVAFITPLVVENPSDSNRINDPYRQRLGELREQLAPIKELSKPDVPESAQPDQPKTGEQPGPRLKRPPANDYQR